jgi:hypothetical protein
MSTGVGMRLSIGDQVRVRFRGPCLTLRLGPRGGVVGHVGVVQAVVGCAPSMPIGETPADPFYRVRFADGQRDAFWREELARRRRRG